MVTDDELGLTLLSQINESIY